MSNKYVVEVTIQDEKEIYTFPTEEKRKMPISYINGYQEDGWITKDLSYKTYEIEKGREKINPNKKIFEDTGDPMKKSVSVCMECGGIKYLKLQEEESETIRICINCGSINLMAHKIHKDSKHEKASYQLWCKECSSENYIIVHGMESDQKICANCGNDTFNWRRIYEHRKALSRCRKCGNEKYVVIPYHSDPEYHYHICADCGNDTWDS